ncbi:MAG: hypothetical protein LBU03_05535 [Tannerellaceae bacterium]|jgi:uncharacterized membrane protein YjfL (UPF0719 family)|nr:hypothetical protein [Tannerellaceae bacterium]
MTIGGLSLTIGSLVIGFVFTKSNDWGMSVLEIIYFGSYGFVGLLLLAVGIRLSTEAGQKRIGNK